MSLEFIVCVWFELGQELDPTLLYYELEKGPS